MKNTEWLIYSPNEAQLARGEGSGGYWSNQLGWVDSESATRFDFAPPSMVFPSSVGNDAQWVPADERQ